MFVSEDKRSFIFSPIIIIFSTNKWHHKEWNHMKLANGKVTWKFWVFSSLLNKSFVVHEVHKQLRIIIIDSWFLNLIERFFCRNVISKIILDVSLHTTHQIRSHIWCFGFFFLFNCFITIFKSILIISTTVFNVS